MTHYTDLVLAKARSMLQSGLSIGGTAVTVKRAPEGNPLGAEVKAAEFPLVAITVDNAAVAYELSSGVTPNIALGLTFVFVAHRANVAAHPTINAPYEYARKGAEAIDAKFDAEGVSWGLSYCMQAMWLSSSLAPDYTDQDQGLYGWETSWQVVIDS